LTPGSSMMTGKPVRTFDHPVSRGTGIASTAGRDPLEPEVGFEPTTCSITSESGLSAVTDQIIRERRTPS